MNLKWFSGCGLKVFCVNFSQTLMNLKMAKLSQKWIKMAPLVYCLVLLSASFLSLRNKVENQSSFVPSDVLRVQYFQLKFPIGIIPRNLEFHLEFYLHKMKSQGLLYLSCAQPLPQDTNSAANKERIIFPIVKFPLSVVR